MNPLRGQLLASITAALVAAGCGSSVQKAPLLPSAFHKGTAPAATTRPATPEPTPAAAQGVPVTNPSYLQTALPSTRPVQLFTGQYQTVGSVVSEVNGNPIYANRIIRQLRGEFAARAREMDTQQFEKFATEEIRKEIGRMQRDELFFGAAERNLDAEDRRVAEMLAMQFRTRKITEAGGSIELAQRRAEADGETFDATVFEEYRKIMVNVYLRKKVYPRIQVSANDMRAYYLRNTSEFSELEKVNFRLIKVDTQISGGKQKARSRAADIRQKAMAGDFAEVARMQNDDPRLARSGGEDSVERGAYKLEKVEKALWGLPVGQVSEPIEDAGGFYIARVDSRTEGHVLPFEDPTVQSAIYKALWGPQSRRLMEEIDLTLRKNAMVRPSNEREAIVMMQPALAIAMQNYPQWASKQN